MIDHNDIKLFADSCMASDSEINMRNAVRSIYYSLYHYSLGIAHNKLRYDYHGSESPHSHLRSFYKKRTDAQLRSVGHILQKLHQDRCRADYDLDDNFTSDDVAVADAHYHQAIKALSRC